MSHHLGLVAGQVNRHRRPALHAPPRLQERASSTIPIFKFPAHTSKRARASMPCVCPTENPTYLCLSTMHCASLPKRVRLTKRQQLQACRQHASNPQKLSVWPQPQFGLSMPPSLSAISKLLKREAKRRHTLPDFFYRKKAPSPAQVQLDTFLVETVLEFETQRKALSAAVARQGVCRLPRHSSKTTAQVYTQRVAASLYGSPRPDKPPGPWRNWVSGYGRSSPNSARTSPRNRPLPS
jgi:hypothetical protein